MTNFKDLTGQKFGRLTVVKRNYASKYVSYFCYCDCNPELLTNKSIKSCHLKSGAIYSCGCTKSVKSKKIRNRKRKIVYAVTICFCKKEFITALKLLKKGETKSCGCLALQKIKEINQEVQNKNFNKQVCANFTYNPETNCFEPPLIIYNPLMVKLLEQNMIFKTKAIRNAENES